jgi:hypothetical protein
MSTQYAVTATLTRETAGGWEATRQLPTFYLDSDTQGIVSREHAERIARELFAWSVAQVELTVWPVTLASNDGELEARARSAGVDPVAYAGEYRAASAAYSQIG